MKILVTGALGHIGSQLIKKLNENCSISHIVMLDNLSTQRYTSLFNLPDNVGYTFVEEDVRKADLDACLNGVDVVVHLAAMTDAAGSADKPEKVHQNNFDSTKRIADACFTKQIPLIFPSSTSVYGSQSELVDEKCADLQPQSPYAESKINEEKYLNSLFQKGLRGVICRLGTIYGTSAGMRFHTAVNKFAWQAVMGKPLTVWKTALHQKRPYLELNDCCDAIAHIIKNKLFDGETYNIVSNNFTVQDVVDEIKACIADLKIILVDHKIMNQLSYEVAPDKFVKTGFKFKGRLSAGVQDTINLLKNSNG